MFNFQGPTKVEDPEKVGSTNAEGPPVPIPNTEVKLCSAENTLLATAREDRSEPTSSDKNLERGSCREKKKKRWSESQGKNKWGCSSAGRAPALQAGGHGFESHHLHQGLKAGRTPKRISSMGL